jgi:hypothetical protein
VKIPASDLSRFNLCDGRCRCSLYNGVLGIDSSHLFLLARSAAVDVAGADAARRLLDWLRLHTCTGQRRLVTSVTCLDHECFRDFQPPASTVEQVSISDICSGIEYGEVRSVIELLPDTGRDDLPEKIIVAGTVLSFDRGERSLVQALGDQDGAAIVTNDEDAFDAIKELVETGVVPHVPIMSLALVEYMRVIQAVR